MAAYDSSDDSDFEGFNPSDIDENESFVAEIGSDISVSPVSSPDVSDFEQSDEDEDETDQYQWRDELRRVTVPAFTAEVGPTFELGPMRSELDFFLKFFPQLLIENIVTETNNYARKVTERTPDPKWTETTLPEMMAFIGIYMIFSIMQVPRYSIAWSSVNYFGIPGLPNIMTRERFEKLSKYFHVNDTANNPPRRQPGHDKLCHVRPVLESVLKLCIDNYNPPKNQSIDEGMIAYKGRLSFKQYLPAKPTKFGIKVWERAHPQTGYVHEFQIYVGKPDGPRGRAEQGLGSRVVKDLTNKIQGKNHHIYMDNFFSSPELFTDLKRQNIFCCGTVRMNRKGLPEGLKNPQNVKNRGDSKTMQKGSLTAVAWKDRKVVHILFNNMDPTEETSAVTRRQRGGDRQDIRCPKVAKIYSKHKGGVDIADQNRMQYSTCRKAKKWWKYLFWFLIDTAVCNALVCMKESANHQLKTKSGRSKKRTQLDFRMNLAKQLIAGHQGARKRKAVSNLDPDGARHWPSRFEKRGRCKMCSSEGRRHEVFLGCKQCQIHLCVDNDCFERYHVKLWK